METRITVVETKRRRKFVDIILGCQKVRFPLVLLSSAVRELIPYQLSTELVSRFVKMCPTCIHKRRQQQPYLSDAYVPPGTFGVPRRIGVVSQTKALEYADEEGESPERYDVPQQNYSEPSNTGGFAAFTPIRRGSEESDVYEQYSHDGQGLNSSPTNQVNGTIDYAAFYMQAMEGSVDDGSLYTLPIPPSSHQHSQQDDQIPHVAEQPFYYQDESGQTYAYDSTGALVPQITYSGLPLPAEYSIYDEISDLSQNQEIVDYSNWQLPPPEVDNSLELPHTDYSASLQQQSRRPQREQQLYELPPLPASAPPYQLSHFPEPIPEPPRRDSMPTLDQTAQNLEYANQQLEEALSQQDSQPLGLALFTETPSSIPSASNPPQSVRRAKPPPLDLGKSSNLFPTTLDPAFRRSATTGVPQYLSANYNLDTSAPLSAPLQRGASNHFTSFRDMLPSPGPSSACSTTSTIFSASSLPLTPGTSCSTSSDAAQSSMGCPDEDGNWHHDSEQLDQAIRLLYDSHIETSGGAVVIHPGHSQPLVDHQHDDLLAHFLGSQQNLDDGMFSALTSNSNQHQLHHQHSFDVGPDETSDALACFYTPERLRRDRMRTRTVSAGPSIMRSGGIGAVEYAASKMTTAQSAGQSVTRTPTKDLRYMPY